MRDAERGAVAALLRREMELFREWTCGRHLGLTLTPDAVAAPAPAVIFIHAAVAGTRGTLMVVVNSVCGCAAGKARPGVALALGHQTRPDIVATVFAGACSRAREAGASVSFAPVTGSSI